MTFPPLLTANSFFPRSREQPCFFPSCARKLFSSKYCNLILLMLIVNVIWIKYRKFTNTPLCVIRNYFVNSIIFTKTIIIGTSMVDILLLVKDYKLIVVIIAPPKSLPSKCIFVVVCFIDLIFWWHSCWPRNHYCSSSWPETQRSSSVLSS